MEEVATEETTVETTTAEPVEGSEEEVVEVTTEVEDSEAAGDLEADPEEDSEAAGDLEVDPEAEEEAAGDLEAALVVKPRSQTTLRRNFCNIRQM
ncbi:uncharacterized protein [Penaeus vannamei]